MIVGEKFEAESRYFGFGAFAHLKELIQLHRGLKPDLKRKIVLEILSKQTR